MSAALVRLIAAVFVAAVVAVGVSAETHHLGNLEPDLDVATWLSGRVFRVGDKLRLQNIGRDEIIVEVGGMEELENCDVANPIRIYTDDVPLEEAGLRYFTSGNPEACRNGLKLPLDVNSPGEFEPPSPFRPFDPPARWPPYGPASGPPPIKPPEPIFPPHGPPPIEPPPEPEPEPVLPPPPHEPSIRIPPPPPLEPIEPPVEPPPPPYEPIEPPVKPPPPPPPPVEPPVHPPPPSPPSSAAPFMNGVSFVILVCGLHMITQFAS